MKLSIGMVVAVALVAITLWFMDMVRDRTKVVEITETVSAYNEWECGYQNQVGCRVVFEVDANTVFEAQRIRYGKDFMALKIHQADLSGWVFSGKGVQVYHEGEVPARVGVE